MGGVRLQRALEGAWPGTASPALLCHKHSWSQSRDLTQLKAAACAQGRFFYLWKAGFPVRLTAAQTAAPSQRGDKKKKTSWAEGWGQGLNEAIITQEQPTVLGTPVKLGMGLWCNLHS